MIMLHHLYPTFVLIAVFRSLTTLAADVPYAPPASPRQTIDFNLDWRFIREDVPGAEAPELQ